MGRKPKYSTDELIGFVKFFLLEKKAYSKIKIPELVDYCNKTLNINPKVTAYMFYRNNSHVRQYIDNLNGVADSLIVDSQKKGSHMIADSLIDIESFLSQTGVQNIKKARELLTIVNRQIINISNDYIQVCEEKKQIFDDLNEAKVLLKKIGISNKKLEKKLAEARKDLKKALSINKKLRGYANKYVMDPLVIDHLRRINIISDQIKEPQYTEFNEEAEVRDLDEVIKHAYEGEVINNSTIELIEKFKRL